MLFKVVFPLGVFLGLSSISYYSLASPFNLNSLDYSFYNDPDLFNKLEKSSYIYKSEIENDEIGAQDYFLQNSLNLMWKKTGENKDIEYGNAFLLNVVFPEWLDKNNPERHIYSPTYYRGKDEIILLIGTSLTFVNKVFSDVNDVKNNVNEHQECKSLTNNSNTLYLSHPYPVIDRSDDNSNNRSRQDFLYRWEENDTMYDDYDFGLHKSFYIKLKTENVCLMYAAANLSVNEDLLKMSISKTPQFAEHLKNVHNKTNVNYVDNVKSIYGKEYKLAADFAVLQIKLEVSNLKTQYLRYISDLYKKIVILPKIYRGSLGIFEGKTQPLYMGGWKNMSEEETDLHAMRNLYVTADVTNRSNKKPSSIISSQVTLKLFDKFSDKTATNPTESTEYEVTDKVLNPNDEDGVLYVYYKIKSKNKGWILPERQEIIFAGFQANSNSKFSEILTSGENNFYSRDDKIGGLGDRNKKLRDFLEAKPRATSEWKEYEIGHSYFSYNSLNDLKFSRASFSISDEVNSELEHSPSVFKFGNKEYLNIGHHLFVPNINPGKYKGTPVLIQDFSVNPYNKKEKALIGMYAGTNIWKNPLGKKKFVGEILLFISPWMYDLVNESNKLSKPSLGDSLTKKTKNKKLVDYIVHTNRWLQDN